MSLRGLDAIKGNPGLVLKGVLTYCALLLFTTEPSASMTTQGYHIAKPCVFKPLICYQGTFCFDITFA